MQNQGIDCYKLFTNVIFLDELMRQQQVEPNPNDSDYQTQINQKMFCQTLSNIHDFK